MRTISQSFWNRINLTVFKRFIINPENRDKKQNGPSNSIMLGVIWNFLEGYGIPDAASIWWHDVHCLRHSHVWTHGERGVEDRMYNSDKAYLIYAAVFFLDDIVVLIIGPEVKYQQARGGQQGYKY